MKTRYFDDEEEDDLLGSIPQIEDHRRVEREPSVPEQKRYALESAVSVHRNPSRKESGDACLSDTEIGLYMVLDGVGAPNLENLASQRAARSLLTWIRASRKRENLIASGSGNPKVEAQRLQMALNKAHEEIKTIGKRISAAPGGFGCSAVAALQTPSHLVVGWLGNARLYRMRAGILKQLTVDHTLASLQILFGLINEVEAQSSNAGQTPNCFLGASGAVDIRLKEVPLQVGDRYLLSSYSLSKSLGEKRILETLTDPAEPRITSEWLVRAAALVEPYDDISVIVIDVKEPTKPSL